MKIATQSVSPIHCDLSVEIWALEDVLMDPVLRSTKADRVFQKLIEATATEIVEAHFNGRRPEDGKTVDMVQDGKTSRVHLQIVRKGRIYKALISTFQFEHSTPSVITDGLVLVEGERRLVARFIAYRDMHFPGPTIEQVPTGQFSDRVPACPPRRPQRSVKPIIHRIVESLLAWGRSVGKRLAPAIASVQRMALVHIAALMTHCWKLLREADWEAMRSRGVRFVDACRNNLNGAVRILILKLHNSIRTSQLNSNTTIDIRLPAASGRLIPDLAEIHGIKPERCHPQPAAPTQPPTDSPARVSRAATSAGSSRNDTTRQNPRCSTRGRVVVDACRHGVRTSDHDAKIAPWSAASAQPPSQSRLHVL